LTTVGVPTFNPVVQFLVVADVPKIGADQDAEFAGKLGFADGSVAGCRFRVSGPSPSGDGRRIVTLWESKEAFETWRDDLLAETLLETSFPVPTFEAWDIDSSYGL
jgi:hypothetical protein